MKNFIKILESGISSFFIVLPMVQNGKFSADAPLLVKTLKNVDFLQRNSFQNDI